MFPPKTLVIHFSGNVLLVEVFRRSPSPKKRFENADREV